jgi:hypothetical protein
MYDAATVTRVLELIELGLDNSMGALLRRAPKVVLVWGLGTPG